MKNQIPRDQSEARATRGPESAGFTGPRPPDQASPGREQEEGAWPAELRLEETKRISRVLRLIGLIQHEPRRWTRRALAERFEVSDRMIDKDLQLLRQGLHCVIERAHGGGYHFTGLPDVRPIGYTVPEALALITALRLALSSGAVDPPVLGAALARTEAALPESFLPLARSLTHALGAAGPESRHRAAILGTLHTALVARRCVRIEYETASRGGQRSERVIRPYAVEPEGQGWMVTAADSLRGEVRDFRIDRMLSAELLEERYEIPPDFDLAQYRGSGWGVLRGMSGPPQHVVLRLTGEEARRLRDQRYDKSQGEQRLADGGSLFTYEVGVTPELARWVFRWGTGCEVLEPVELRTMVAEMARTVGELNGGVPSKEIAGGTDQPPGLPPTKWLDAPDGTGEAT